jgi:hypothetical protein
MTQYPHYKLYTVQAGSLKKNIHHSYEFESIKQVYDFLLNFYNRNKSSSYKAKPENQYCIQQYTMPYKAEIVQVFKVIKFSDYYIINKKRI